MRDALMHYNLPGPPGLADHTMQVLGRRPEPQGPGGLVDCADEAVPQRRPVADGRRLYAAFGITGTLSISRVWPSQAAASRRAGRSSRSSACRLSAARSSR